MEAARAAEAEDKIVLSAIKTEPIERSLQFSLDNGIALFWLCIYYSCVKTCKAF